jgi:DnaJ like chaperone protein
MSWWGKLVGGAFGFMIMGPIGALLGAALGHNFDRGIDLQSGPAAGDQERVQTVFFTTVFAVMGHLAKADGRVSREEIAMAENVMTQMQLEPEQRKVAIRLFNEGKREDFPLDEVLYQFRQECHRRTNLIQMFLEILIATAMADGRLDDAERGVMLSICQFLGIPRPYFEQLLSMVTAQQHFAGSGPRGHTVPPSGASIDDAYKVLGIPASASDDEVKKAYRRQMNQHHPDKLVAKGLPEEMLKIATEKTQEIKAAYELIKRNRRGG